METCQTYENIVCKNYNFDISAFVGFIVQVH